VRQLSPAAQAVIDASWGGIPAGMRDPYVVRCEQMAAAIRAAVEQSLPRKTEPERCINCEPSKDVAFIGAWHIWNTENRIRAKLLAIATELESLP
jgi:hypothetical protein